RKSLREPGHALDEEVAAREESDHEPFDEVVLADDHLLDLEKNPPCVGGHRCLRLCHQSFTPLSPAVRRARLPLYRWSPRNPHHCTQGVPLDSRALSASAPPRAPLWL